MRAATLPLLHTHTQNNECEVLDVLGLINHLMYFHLNSKAGDAFKTVCIYLPAMILPLPRIYTQSQPRVPATGAAPLKHLAAKCLSPSSINGPTAGDGGSHSFTYSAPVARHTSAGKPNRFKSSHLTYPCFFFLLMRL